MGGSEIAGILLSAGAVELRTTEPYFTFASGIKSPVYTDNRLLISDPVARRAIRDAFAARIMELGLEPEVIAGTATAGIPHAAFLAEELSLPMVYIRGAAKGHGKQNRVEGRLEAGRRVLVIEDLISTGGSSVSAAEAVREAGAEVVAVMAIFSYGFESTKERFGAAGFDLAALVTFDEVVELALGRGDISADDAELLGRWSRDPESWPGPAPDDAPGGEPEEGLIVAADLAGAGEVEKLARCVAASAGCIKLNSAFIAHGPDLVASVKKLGPGIFLDLKFHDIPNTVANHAREAVRMGVRFLTIHAGGGAKMIAACSEALTREARALGVERPRALAVTALTSMSDGDLATTGVSGGRDEQVARLARLAKDSGADGVVCSVAEARAVRSACGGGFLVVTPGVRPAGSPADDHARSATPADAVAAGADYIVVGRPVYRAEDPGLAARMIAAELAAARKRRA